MVENFKGCVNGVQTLLEGPKANAFPSSKLRWCFFSDVSDRGNL
jgi:hypothetical protein